MAEQVRCVLQAGASTGECPIWSETEARLYWIDVQEPALHRFDPATGHDEHWTLPADIGCYALGEDGRVLVALRNGLAWLDLVSGALANAADPPYDPRRFTFNDGRAGPQGRFWTGPMHQPYEGVPPGGPERLPLWRFDPATGEFAPMTDPVGTSNGLAWSMDGETMYHSDTSQHLIWAYRFHGDEGRLSDKRVLAEVPGPQGSGPDGGCCDAEGYYWSAIFGGGRLIRFDPKGRVERQVEMPVQHPTMCAFGGSTGRTAFVTSAGRMVSPAERRKPPFDGGLFSFEAPAPGLPAHRVRPPQSSRLAAPGS